MACPFYGFWWPAHSSTLQYVGGNECGLDIDQNGACRMDAESRPVNYFACPLVQERHEVLYIAKQLIKFDAGDGRPQALGDWERHFKR
jgi:hypothetical protein